MINEQLTFEKFGYYGKDLAPKASKKIIVSCNGCGKIREIKKHAYRDLCLSCSKKGKPSPNKGNIYSEKSKQKISLANKGKRAGIKHTEEAKLKISLANTGSRRTEEQKQKISGKNHWLWKGGISPLRDLIYKCIEHVHWRTACFIRDKGLCQDCGVKDKKAEVHHIKPFREILQEFLKLYSQFSPIEDKETLLRLAKEYKPFWEVSNGKTLCLKCHHIAENKVSKEY